MTAQEAYNKLKGVDLWNESMDIMISDLSEDMVQMNKDQLWDGKTTEGVNITPGYMEDPYFETPKKGQNYAIWKKKISGNPARSFNTPNFFIDGRLVYDTLKVKKNADHLEIEPDGSYDGSRAADFDKKYKNIYGLTRNNLNIIIEKLKPKLKVRIKQKLGI